MLTQAESLHNKLDISHPEILNADNPLGGETASRGEVVAGGRGTERGPEETRREAHSPEPFAPETGHGEHAPVDEDAELGLVEPSGQRSGVQGLPGGVEARGAGETGRGQQQQQVEREPYPHPRPRPHPRLGQGRHAPAAASCRLAPGLRKRPLSRLRLLSPDQTVPRRRGPAAARIRG